MIIRSATLNDAQAIADIYQPYVLETAISFELEPPSVSEMKSRMVEVMAMFPWLVSEVDGRVLGYAYACPFRSRPAYRWSVESSIYVQRGCERIGLGKALYSQLLEMLKHQGVVNVMGGMTLPNVPSQKLHEHFGFVEVARYKGVGFKMGQWRDVGHWQLQLARPEDPRELLKP